MQQQTIRACIIAIVISQPLFAMKQKQNSRKHSLKKIATALFSFVPRSENQSPVVPAIVNDQVPLNWLPKDIRNYLTALITHETADECISRMTADERIVGIGLHARLAEQKSAQFKHFSIALNYMNSLSLLGRKQQDIFSSTPSIFMRKLYCAQGDSLQDKITTIGGLTLTKAGIRQVTHCNVSSNNKFLTYLVTRFNEVTHEFKPVSVHIIDTGEQEEIKKLELEQLIIHSNTWQPNSLDIDVTGLDNYQIRKKRAPLEALGYREGREQHGDGKRYIQMVNDIIGIACDSYGNFVSIADYTGVMLIDMEKGTITKAAQENLSAFNRSYLPGTGEIMVNLPFHIGFNKPGTLLVYGGQSMNNRTVNTPQYWSIVVPKNIDTNIDHLQKWLHDNRVCKKLSNNLMPEKNQ